MSFPPSSTSTASPTSSTRPRRRHAALRHPGGQHDPPAGNTINLTVAGTYKITLPGTPGETDNAAGEFAICPPGRQPDHPEHQRRRSSSTATTSTASSTSTPIDTDNTDAVHRHPAGLHHHRRHRLRPANRDGPGASGGGIRDQGNASLTLNNMIVTNNIATADGGGISMENLVSTPWTLTVNNSIISNNHAGDAGGGVETDGSGKVFINAGTVITGNTCVNQGGGIWLDAIQVGRTVPGGQPDRDRGPRSATTRRH